MTCLLLKFWDEEIFFLNEEETKLYQTCKTYFHKIIFSDYSGDEIELEKYISKQSYDECSIIGKKNHDKIIKVLNEYNTIILEESEKSILYCKIKELERKMNWPENLCILEIYGDIRSLLALLLKDYEEYLDDFVFVEKTECITYAGANQICVYDKHGKEFVPVIYLNSCNHQVIFHKTPKTKNLSNNEAGKLIFQDKIYPTIVALENKNERNCIMVANKNEFI